MTDAPASAIPKPVVLVILDGWGLRPETAAYVRKFH